MTGGIESSTELGDSLPATGGNKNEGHPGNGSASDPGPLRRHATGRGRQRNRRPRIAATEDVLDEVILVRGVFLLIRFVRGIMWDYRHAGYSPRICVYDQIGYLSVTPVSLDGEDQAIELGDDRRSSPVADVMTRLDVDIEFVRSANPGEILGEPVGVTKRLDRVVVGP